MNTHNIELVPLMLSSKYEIGMTKVLKNFIKKDWIICDIGAYIGYHTTLFSKLTGENGKIISVEPEPNNYKLLKKNIRLNNLNNVTTYSIAISDKKGKGIIYSPNENAPDSRIFKVPGENRHETKVKTDTLDNLLRKEKKINLIKIDIQGWEERALKGAGKTFKKNKDIYLITEFQPSLLSKAGTDSKKYLKMISKFGFKIYLIDEKKQKLKRIKKLENLIEITKKTDGGFVDLLCSKSTLYKNKIS